jgi:FtsP/CotA-like multicopper oxidase with cupredoxin domain
VLAVALVATVLVMRPSTGAGAEPANSDPYAVTTAVDADPAPDVFETTIVAQPVTRGLGNGVTAEMWGYNGTVPGPEIRVGVGDTLVVHYRNELPLPSGIHWHGIELANQSDGTALTQNRVPPGGEFLYRFRVPRPGIFWYHPHHHPTNQVFRGLYGSLIVEDPHDDTLRAAGVLPPRDRTRTLLLSDTTVCKEPGHNDTDTYDDSLPHASGGPLPEQMSPFPADLCDRPLDDHGDPIRDVQGRPIPLRAGEIPNIQKLNFQPGAGRVNEGQTVLVNGRSPGGRSGSPGAPGALAPGTPTIDMAAGQGLRLQAVNAATVRYFRLRLTDSSGRMIPLVRVGGEGGLLDHARLEGGIGGGGGVEGVIGFNTKFAKGELVLAPSDRSDFVIAVPREAPVGTATLWTLDYQRTGENYANVPTVPVMHLDVSPPTSEAYAIAEGSPLRAHPAVSDPVEPLGPQGPLSGFGGDPFDHLLDPAAFSPPKPGSANERISITVARDTPALGIDGTTGTHDRGGADYRAVPHSASTRYARVGDLLELRVFNNTAAHHPFHLHGFSFQPVALEPQFGFTYTYDYREFVDTLDIPSRYTLRFRVRLDERPLVDGATPGGAAGRWVFHCHIFFHATMGMNAELVVVGPDGNERPYVDADAASVSVDEGGVASATGTVADPDGDPVALAASEGTVADLGGGRWAWSSDGPVQGSTVYVTAIDSDGLRGQVAFDVAVANVAPTVTVTSPAGGTGFGLGTTVTVTAAVTDPGADGLLACRFDWDDGLGSGPPIAPVDGVCHESRTLAGPGIRTVTVTASDDAGATGFDSTVVALYDPDGGFVTGSGTTGSPPTAFDVAARYHKPATAPIGHVVVGDLTSTSLEWLVVSGARAWIRGTGTIGGTGNHGFLLTVVDGSPDRLRLELWEGDRLDPSDPPPITAGNVVIHR